MRLRWQLLPQSTEQEQAQISHKVTWLELFYDLVFVVTITQLGNLLSHHITPSGILVFITLFILIWWAWHNTALYFNRCSIDNFPRRLLVFAQVFAVGNLAITLSGAFGETSSSFAFAYSAIRLALVLLYLIMDQHVPQARPMIRRYITGFGIGAFLWLGSGFVPQPFRYLIWVLALGIDLYTTLSSGTRKQHGLLPLNIPRLSERYGQFTLIVLGESFIETVNGLVGKGVSLASLVFSAIAFVFITSIWWTYFDNLSGTTIKSDGASLVWTYLHLPLTMGITMTGVALEKVVLLKFDSTFAASHRLLLYSAMMISFIAIAIIDAVTENKDGTAKGLRILSRLGTALILGLLLVLGGRLNQLVSLSLAALTCLVQMITETMQSFCPSTWTSATKQEG